MKVGQPVTFTAVIETPKNMGKVVTSVWNFEGLPKDFDKGDFRGWNFETSGIFPVVGKFTPSDKTGSRVTLKTTYKFSKPGTYSPRSESHRNGKAMPGQPLPAFKILVVCEWWLSRIAKIEDEYKEKKLEQEREISDLKSSLARLVNKELI